MQIPDPSGENIPLSPPWHMILDYEFEMRRKQVKTAQTENRPLHEVLQEVTENTELQDLESLLCIARHFLSYAETTEVCKAR